MNPSPLFAIEALVVPGRSEADGMQIARTLQVELARLWHEDQAIGLAWTDRIEAVELYLDDRLPPFEIGQALARSIRERSLRGTGAA